MDGLERHRRQRPRDRSGRSSEPLVVSRTRASGFLRMMRSSRGTIFGSISGSLLRNG